MSTTFGIAIPKQILDNNSYISMHFIDIEETKKEYIIPIAFRSRGIRFTNPIAHLLPSIYPVIPMDNSAQGIETIGDIVRESNILHKQDSSDAFKALLKFVFEKGKNYKGYDNIYDVKMDLTFEDLLESEDFKTLIKQV